MLVWQQSSHSSWMQNALKRLLKFVLIWCVFPCAIQTVRDILEHLCHICIYIHISIKTLSRFVWKGAACVCKTSIHLVYVLSMVVLQITDTNDIAEFVSVHVCAYVHATLTWPFTVKVAFLLDTPGTSHFSRHLFGFALHCMTYLNSGPGWISQESLQPSCMWDKWGFVLLVSGAGPMSFLTNSHINSESMKKNKTKQ